MAYPSLKSHILFDSNGLAIWHSFPDSMHIKVNNDRSWSFEFFQGILPPEITEFVL